MGRWATDGTSVSTEHPDFAGDDTAVAVRQNKDQPQQMVSTTRVRWQATPPPPAAAASDNNARRSILARGTKAMGPWITLWHLAVGVHAS